MNAEARRALLDLLLFNRYDIYSSGGNSIISSYLADVMVYLTSIGIELTDSEKAEAIGFIGGFENVYRLIAEIIGFNGDWSLVINCLFYGDVETADGTMSDAELMDANLVLADTLAPGYDKLGEPVGKAVAATLRKAARHGRLVEQLSNLEQQLGQHGWSRELIMAAGRQYTDGTSTTEMLWRLMDAADGN